MKSPSREWRSALGRWECVRDFVRVEHIRQRRGGHAETRTEEVEEEEEEEVVVVDVEEEDVEEEDVEEVDVEEVDVEEEEDEGEEADVEEEEDEGGENLVPCRPCPTLRKADLSLLYHCRDGGYPYRAGRTRLLRARRGLRADTLHSCVSRAQQRSKHVYFCLPDV